LGAHISNANVAEAIDGNANIAEAIVGRANVGKANAIGMRYYQ
jgi:hypothetical protein